MERSVAWSPEAFEDVESIAEYISRERIVYSYRLVYRIDPDRILIVAVIHGSKLLDNISERF